MTAARAIRAWLASAEVPSDLPRWPADWATRVARDAERLRDEGVRAEEAWLRAADLHRPAGVPGPSRHELQALRTPKPPPPPPPPPPTGAALVVLTFLREQSRPVTCAEIMTATGLSKNGVNSNLPLVARRAGSRRIDKRHRAATWRAK